MTDTHQHTSQSVSVTSVRDRLNDLVHLRTAHTERLEGVQEELRKLHEYKSDYVHLKKRLCTLSHTTTHQVMVPFGGLALMPGRLLHTNEVLVLLGDNWFAERSTTQAINIVNRRIQDCDNKIHRAESTRSIHLGWLRETDEILTGESGERVEIVEQMSEQEYQRDQEQHRINVTKQHQQERERKKQERERSEEEERFTQTLGDKDKKNYEDIMKRLDALEMEEEEDDDEEEEDEEGIDEEEEEEIEDEGRTEGEIDGSGEKGGREVGEKGDVSTDVKVTDTTTTTTVDKITLDAIPGTTDTDTATTTSCRHLKQKPKLKRRVSWADDAKPLYTIIPDDTNKQIYRIKYCSGPLSLSLDLDPQDTTTSPQNPGEGTTQPAKAGIRSPSDLYRAFAGVGEEVGVAEGAAGGDGGGGVEEEEKEKEGHQKPRGILKKATSLPLQDDDNGGEGWCLPPAPMDLEDEDSPPPPTTPPPPPSPPPHRTSSSSTSSQPAFTYCVQEHKPKTPKEESTSTSSTSTSTSSTSVSAPDPQPKRISKFKASRIKK
ncbi:hypothetical protein Pcinc_035706 [Petrolisthes cinctipes]|uniref:Unconventional prefoldin RPB5 interactor n=1 Tax=Petrolisthes cinctipes TaxID=88211 RepID=A0AAE1BZB9_PETCI|nr:hypothetical protein Pcinc_035706 [Petrolisthes cinctipes]